MAETSSDDFCKRIEDYFNKQMQELKDYIFKPTGIKWLDIILSELFAINPFHYDDETLWNMMNNREHATNHPYHCLIVKFGDIVNKRYINGNDCVNYEAIQVQYLDKQSTKKISDLIYPLKDNNGNKISSHIILPWSWHDTQIKFNRDNINSLLVNKQFLLLYSIRAINKFSKNINLWSLVALKDNIEENAKIIREYILKAQLWALMNLHEAPNSFFNFEISDTIKRDIIRPIEFVCGSRLSTARFWNIPKKNIPDNITPKRKQYIENYQYNSSATDKSNDSYLDDELDYIRQNGGDWIDD